MKVEHLAQPDNGRKVNQALVLEFGNQFFLGFALRFAGDRAEESARRFLKSFHGAIGKRVAFLAPKFPADVARDIRSEERRVGKECRSRWWRWSEKSRTTVEL